MTTHSEHSLCNQKLHISRGKWETCKKPVDGSSKKCIHCRGMCKIKRVKANACRSIRERCAELTGWGTDALAYISPELMREAIEEAQAAEKFNLLQPEHWEDIAKRFDNKRRKAVAAWRVEYGPPRSPSPTSLPPIPPLQRQFPEQSDNQICPSDDSDLEYTGCSGPQNDVHWGASRRWVARDKELREKAITLD